MDSGQLCVYCGARQATTHDHIPPKLLLTKPFPANLVTVPACFECNHGFEKDDEYTRTVVLMDTRIADVPAAKSNMAALSRSFERPQSAGFIRYLASQIEPAALYGSDGRMLNKLNRDPARTDATGLHVLRGLHFVETGGRLDPCSASVQIASKMGIGVDHPLFSKFLAYYEKAPDTRQGTFGDCFSYRAIVREHRSAWLFVLYEKFSWFALVG